MKAASSFRLSNIEEAIKNKQEEKEQQKQIKETVDDGEVLQDGEEVLISSISIENLDEQWRKLMPIFVSRKQPSLSNAIQQSKIRIDQNTVIVTVEGQIAKQMMMEEYSFLVNHIKETTGANRFSLEVEATQLNIQAPTTYTKQEQLAYIMKENSAIEKLCKLFSLEIDYNG